MLSFSDKEQKLLVKIASLYKKTKPLILFSEEIDPNYEGNVQVWKELRDALDHLMRVFNRKLEKETLDEDDLRYIHSNLHKTVGHIYRAGCDALEGACLSLRSEIGKICEAFDLETLNAVIPSYWDKYSRLYRRSKEIAKLRAQKDVTDDEMERIFNAFVDIVEELRKLYEELQERVPALKEYQRKKEAEDHKQESKRLKHDVIVALIGAAIGAAATILISYLH